MEVALSSEAILGALTHYDRLPVDAIRAADADRATMLPVFLETIERYIAQAPDERERPNPLSFIFNILGSWLSTAGKTFALRTRQSHCGRGGRGRNLAPGHGGGIRWRSGAAVSDHPRPGCRRVHPLAHVPGGRYCGPARRASALRGSTVPGLDTLEPKEDCFVWFG